MKPSRTRSALAAVALLLALAAVTASTFPATAASPGKAPAPTPAPAARSFGVTMPGVPGDLAPLRALSSSLGRSPDRVMWYVAWSSGTDFPAAAAADVAATGATPVITWEPWDPAAGADQPAYSLDRIAAGAFDTYLSRWARQVKAYGKPVVLRFAHEMNGSWYPWSAQANGNTPSDYVPAWRHVVSVFSRAKVTNVRWSWSPNVPYPGSTPLSALYPGDTVVDEVALDGYNWGGVQAGAVWTSFEDVFSQGFAELAALTSRPAYVGEVGAPEVGGDKAAWVSGMFATLAARPDVRGFTWFDFDKEADWRIDSSAATFEAFRLGLGTY